MDATTATTVKVEHGGEVVMATLETWQAEADKLVAKHGPGVPKVTTTADVPGSAVGVPGATTVTVPATILPAAKLEAAPAPVFSDFGHGRQVVDEGARARIEAQHKALQAGGVAVDAGRQLYATGTRMAEVGYANQADRKREHEAKMELGLAAGQLRETVAREQREDVVVSAGELARGITVNGKVAAFGLALSEQAIRGLLGRIESPALGYVLGIRERIARELAKPAEERNLRAVASDKAQIAEVLQHECMKAADVALKLRKRNALRDVFAIVSPSYTPADAPEVIDQILGKMPGDARGSWSYDPASTTWELRANVWTPVPVAEQAVGEAFEGFVSFQSRDNGTSKFRGGGGVTLLACLNAGTYIANGSDVARMHRGNVMVDIEAMLRGSLTAIEVLCKAWGTARETVAEDERLVGMPVSQAIPGLWWGELRDRRSELAGVLPGRTAEHVERLTAAYFAERRDRDRIVRADLAQGWTRYIQDQPAPVRREAEAAVGSWLVNPSPMRFDPNE